jgi:hypothetical protein
MQYLFFVWEEIVWGVGSVGKIVREKKSRGGRAVVVAKKREGRPARAVSLTMRECNTRILLTIPMKTSYFYSN